MEEKREEERRDRRVEEEAYVSEGE